MPAKQSVRKARQARRTGRVDTTLLALAQMIDGTDSADVARVRKALVTAGRHVDQALEEFQTATELALSRPSNRLVDVAFDVVLASKEFRALRKQVGSKGDLDLHAIVGDAAYTALWLGMSYVHRCLVERSK
jgi:hypothetical protein